MDGLPDCQDLCPLDVNKQRPGICIGPEWLAMESLATHQSSTQLSKMSYLAVDAATSANFHHGSCTLTNAESNAWWYVDLGFGFDVKAVRITPRTDCCAGSLLGVEVWVTSISILADVLSEIAVLARLNNPDTWLRIPTSDQT